MTRQRWKRLFLVEHRLLLTTNGVDMVIGSKSFGLAGMGMLTVNVLDNVFKSFLDADDATCWSNEAEPAKSLALLLLTGLGLRSLAGIFDLSLSLSAAKAKGSTDSDAERCNPALLVLVLNPAALLLPQQTYSANS